MFVQISEAQTKHITRDLSITLLEPECKGDGADNLHTDDANEDKKKNMEKKQEESREEEEQESKEDMERRKTRSKV